jgi:hypothetical protein
MKPYNMMKINFTTNKNLAVNRFHWKPRKIEDFVGFFLKTNHPNFTPHWYMNNRPMHPPEEKSNMNKILDNFQPISKVCTCDTSPLEREDNIFGYALLI